MVELYSPPMSPTHAVRDPVRLKLTDDKGFEKTVLLDADRLVIGSHHSCNLVMPGREGEALAPRHATVTRQDDRFILTDESGPRGTRVNGRPIRSTLLKHGDVITLGSSTLKIQFLIEGTRASDLEQKRLRILLAALHELHAGGPPNQHVSRVAVNLLLLFDCEWAAVMIAIGTKQEIVATAGAPGGGRDSGRRLARQVAATGRSSFSAVHLCVPVPSGNTPAGVLETGPKRNGSYQGADLEILEAVASHLGIAMANAHSSETRSAGSALAARRAD